MTRFLALPLGALCLVLALGGGSFTTAFVPDGSRLPLLRPTSVLQQPQQSSKEEFRPLAAPFQRRHYASLQGEREKGSGDAVERPDPSILLSAKGDASQRFGFIAICVSLAVGTYLAVDFLEFVEWILPDNWYELWRDFTWPVGFGLIFVAAGAAHFLQKEAFFAMVPPQGTWGGLWQVPAPGADKFGLTYEEFHTYWTGIAELGGGLLLIAGGLSDAPQIPAFLLFLLTAAVTPANIYMATHDVQPPGLPPIPYPLGHFYRGVAQCILLAFLFKLAFQY
ncbi:hypothetical protein ACA910_001265 [Epithemia clementina (nom. ined.)]